MELHRPWDTPNIVAAIIDVVAGGGSHHKLLLNLGTLKFSTDTRPLVAAVPQCLVHVEILVNLVEILVNLVLDGVK